MQLSQKCFQMNEFFVPIMGYEGLYEISNTGRVKSLSKMGGPNYSVPINEKIKNLRDNGIGYKQVSLSKDSIKKTFYVHILVARHFVANTNNYPEVNHVNGDKNCNESWNLQWCTRKQNEEHAWAAGLKKMKGDKHPLSKRVLQISLSGVVIKNWDNGHQVMQELGFANAHISKCCRGLAKTAYGFKWAYA